MEFRQLEYFLQVVEHRSVTAAATHLHVSQPSLSQALRRLERELGSSLFDRVGRGMRLTAAGEALVAPARRMLTEREAAHAVVADVRGLRGGRFNVASLPSLAVDPLAGIVGQFLSSYPLVRVSVAESTQAEQVVARVESGECEIGLSPTIGADGHLDVHEIETQPMALVVPAGLTTPPGPLSASDLAELSFICGPVGGSSRRALEEFMAEHGESLRIAVETESTEAIVPMVQAGAGVALIPKGLALSGGRLTRVLMTTPTIRRRTFILWRPGLSSPGARAFLEMARGWKLNSAHP